MVRGRVLIVIAVLAGAIAIPALASSGGREVVGNCTHSQVRPASIVIYCADVNGLLERLRWSSFGGRTATATGEYSLNDCTPDCAAGRFHSYPIEVVLTDARTCPDKHDDYRDATLTYTAARPPGTKTARVRLSLPGCPLGG